MRICLALTSLALTVVAAPASAQAVAPPPVVVVSAAPPASAPVDPASLALAQEILELGFPPEMREKMIGSNLDAVLEQTRKATASLGKPDDPEFQAIVEHANKRMFDQMKVILAAQIPDIFDSMAHAYARMFTTAELTEILAFVKTPTGQRYLQRSADVLKDPDVQAANQRMAAKLVAKVPELTRQTMQEVEDYVAKKEKAVANRTHAS